MFGQMTAGSWIYIGSQESAGQIPDVCRSGAEALRNIVARRLHRAHRRLGGMAAPSAAATMAGGVCSASG